MASNEPAIDKIRGTLRSADGVGVIRIEARLDAGVDEVWSALTEPDRLADWYGEIQGDPKVGGGFQATLFATGWEGTGRVDACEPNQRLVTATKDAELPNEDSIEVTLSTEDAQTIVVVEQRGIPLNMLWAYGAGLQIHVEDLLGHISGRERTDSKPRFDALMPRCQALAADLT